MANTVAQIRDVLQARKNVLRERYQVESLFLFGSMCTGTHRPDSDIDLLVEFEPMSEGYADAYFGLLDALQTLLRKPVDLVVESAIRNPYFRQSVEASRTPLYAA